MMTAWRLETAAVTKPIPFTPDLTVKPEVTGFFDAEPTRSATW